VDALAFPQLGDESNVRAYMERTTDPKVDDRWLVAAVGVGRAVAILDTLNHWGIADRDIDGVDDFARTLETVVATMTRAQGRSMPGSG